MIMQSLLLEHIIRVYGIGRGIGCEIQKVHIYDMV